MVTKQIQVCLKIGSYEDEVLCDMIAMDACHILLGKPWKYDRYIVHRGRSNEYELKFKGNTITLKAMFVAEIRSMRNQQGRKPSLSMMAIEKEETEE